MKTLFLYGLLFVIVAAPGFSSCGKNGNSGIITDPCNGVSKQFGADVNPVIQTFCNKSGCHGPGSINGPGPLTSYNEIFSARDRIRIQVSAGLMPQDATLTTAQRNAIICWIDNGAPDK